MRELSAAYNRRDRETVGRLLHPNVEWQTVGGPLLGIGAVHGRDAMLRFVFEQIPEDLDNYRVIPEDFTDLGGEGVLLVARYEGRGVSSGADVNMHISSIYRFEEGTICFVQDFESKAEALEAVGLSEQDAHADS